MTKHFGDGKRLKEGKHKPEECTPEQIRECHGDVAAAEHPCIKRDEEK